MIGNVIPIIRVIRVSVPIHNTPMLTEDKKRNHRKNINKTLIIKIILSITEGRLNTKKTQNVKSCC